MEEGKQGRAEISPLSQPKQNIAGRVEQMKYLTVQGPELKSSSTMARPPQQKWWLMGTISCSSFHDCPGTLTGEFPFFRNCDCFYNFGKGPCEPYEFQELSETLELCLLSESCLSRPFRKKCFNLEYIAIPQHLRHLLLS